MKIRKIMFKSKDVFEEQARCPKVLNINISSKVQNLAMSPVESLKSVDKTMSDDGHTPDIHYEENKKQNKNKCTKTIITKINTMLRKSWV